MTRVHLQARQRAIVDAAGAAWFVSTACGQSLRQNARGEGDTVTPYVMHVTCSICLESERATMVFGALPAKKEDSP